MQSNSFDNCVHRYNIEVLNLFDPELQLINSKSMIKNKFKELLSEWKKSEVQTILILHYKKINNCKIFNSNVKLIARDLDINEAVISIISIISSTSIIKNKRLC